MRVVLVSVQPKGVLSIAGAQVYAYQSHIGSKGALMKAFADIVKSMIEQGGLIQLPKDGLSTPGALAVQHGGVKGLGDIRIKADTPSLLDSTCIQGVVAPAASSPAQVKSE